MHGSTTRDIWARDLNNIAEALEPWHIEIDGSPYLALDAPSELSRLMRELGCIGYANGWL